VAWQNAQLYVQEGKEIDLRDGNESGNKLVTVDVWSQVATSILAKVVDGTEAAETATDASHPGGGWATLTFDFAVGKDNTSGANDIFSRILFFPIWNGSGYDTPSEFATYYDNITKAPAAACTADAGTVIANNEIVPLNSGTATITATASGDISVPTDYETLYVLTSGSGLVIQQTSTTALSFDVTETGLWTLHTLVAETSDDTDPNYLDLTIVQIGVTTGVDVLNAIDAAGICASLDAAGAPVTVVNSISQTIIEDFESSIPVITDPEATPPGAAGALVGDNILELALEANPDSGPVVGDSQVLKVITDASKVAWQNAQLYVQEGKEIDLRDGNESGNKLVTVDVWSQAATSILAKVVDGTEAAETATDASHPGGGWATLTFDFAVGKDNTSGANDIFSRILFFPIWNGSGYDTPSEFTTYYDNIAKVETTLSSNDVEKLSFIAFPNPTQNSWTISTKNESITSIQVFDVLGKNVLSLLPNERTAVIDGSSFKAGLYFAQIKTVSGLSSLKLIKK
jgi:hypothetical protein